MLSSISYGAKRADSYDVESDRLAQRLVPHDRYYEKNLLTTTSTSSASLSHILRQIQTKRYLKEQSLRRRSKTNESMFEFLDQKSRLYECQYKVYNFFHKPNHFLAFLYHILVFCLVLTCLVMTVFASINSFSQQASSVLVILEKIIIVWFANEFFLRLWSSSCRKRYEGWRGKLLYLRVPSHLLDILVIGMSSAVLIADTRKGSAVFAASAFRGFHRLFQVFQMLTLRQKIQPWKLLWHVIRDQIHQLLIIIYIEFISVFVLAYVSYLLEKDADNTQLTNLAEAMWWAVITLSTVGYGDKVHVTWWGKLISSLFTILGVALFALPAGIIGAGMAIRIEKEELNRKKKNRKLSAVLLIQSTWRCYKTVDGSEDDIGVKNLFVIDDPKDSRERIALRFVRLCKFFAAKSKFKSMSNVLDVENAAIDQKFNKSEVNCRVKRVKDIVDAIDKTIVENDIEFNARQRRLLERIDRICSLMALVESQVNRQNALIDFISFNSVLSENQLKCLTQVLDKSEANQRHNSLIETKSFHLNRFLNVENKYYR